MDTRSSVQDVSHAGQAVYTPFTLAIYDVLVLGVSNKLIWRCPTHKILSLYDRHVSAHHLDVGVGTGWFLDRGRFPPDPCICLLDLNANSLAAASRRVARYRPQTIRADVLRPITYDGPPFASISMTYLLHCLPGAIPEKAAAFDHLRPLLRPDGVVFGATLLSQGVRRSAIAARLMRVYNEKGIFSNTRDSVDDLRAALQACFEDVELDLVGCGALFVARRPRQS